MLARSNRLTSGEDFRRALRSGRRAGTRTLVVHAAFLDAAVDESVVDESAAPRVGFTVSRAVGIAVTRNRVKRRLRHAVRPLLGQLPEGTLLVVRALPPAATASFAQLEDDLARCLARLDREAA